MEIGVSVGGLEDAAALVTGLPTALQGNVVKAMRTIGLTLQATLQRDVLSGQMLGVRTGQGRRSIFYRVEVVGDKDVQVVVGPDLTDAPYMRIHEYGGTITAKGGGSLTIPLDAALTAKGVARFSARDVIGNPESFGYTGTFFAKGIIFGKVGTGEGASIVPLFVLKQSVQIKPVGYMRATAADKQDWILSQLGIAVDDTLAGKSA